jgi:hypothetical protein
MAGKKAIAAGRATIQNRVAAPSKVVSIRMAFIFANVRMSSELVWIDTVLVRYELQEDFLNIFEARICPRESENALRCETPEERLLNARFWSD